MEYPIASATRHRELTLRDLTLFALSCVFAARWLPLGAQAGPGSITLWILAALFFSAPLAIAVAALVAKYPSAGGIYRWTREDFGPWHGFLAGWVYWIGIAFLFPTAALLYGQVALSLLGPGVPMGLARPALIATSAAMIWVGLSANLVGLRIGKWAENLGGLASGALVGLLGVVAWLTWNRRGSATAMDIRPALQWNTISFWAAIAYATSGMEGPGAMAIAAKDPERTMRRAGWLAALTAALLYIAGTIAFLVILPPARVTALEGFTTLAAAASETLGIPWLAPVIAGLVLLSGVGFVGGIGTATSELPFGAAGDGLLPESYGRLHPRWGTPHRAIISLGVVSTFLLLVSQLGDTAQAAFDGLVALMVITGFIPYLYLFGSSWKAGRHVSATAGGLVTILAIVAAVVPTDHVTALWFYEAKITVGTVATIGTAWLLYRRSAARAPMAA